MTERRTAASKGGRLWTSPSGSHAPHHRHLPYRRTALSILPPATPHAAPRSAPCRPSFLPVRHPRRIRTHLLLVGPGEGRRGGAGNGGQHSLRGSPRVRAITLQGGYGKRGGKGRTRSGGDGVTRLVCRSAIWCDGHRRRRRRRGDRFGMAFDHTFPLPPLARSAGGGGDTRKGGHRGRRRRGREKRKRPAPHGRPCGGGKRSDGRQYGRRKE